MRSAWESPRELNHPLRSSLAFGMNRGKTAAAVDNRRLLLGAETGTLSRCDPMGCHSF